MPELNDESLLPKHRLEALCDGIFAITMTLMILDLKTPENIPYNLASKELPDILWNLLPSVEAYAISFIILGIFWLRHQIQFKYVDSVDRALLLMNLIFLLLIGFVPFTVGVMMRYPSDDLPFQIYIINLLIISILLYFQWHYISNHEKIIIGEAKSEMKKRFLLLSGVPILIFFISLLISFIDVRTAFLIIYLDPLFYTVYRAMIKKKTF